MLSFLLCEVSSSVKFEVTQQAVILIQVLHAGEANKKLFQSTSVPMPVINQNLLIDLIIDRLMLTNRNLRGIL